PKPPVKIASAMDAPKIEILEPPISALRSIGKPKIPLADSIDNPVTIRGKVSPAAEVTQLLINGKSTSPDAQGNFSTRISVDPSGTDVSIVAANQQGKSTDVDFTLLLPERSTNSKTTVADSQDKAPSGVNFGRYYAVVIGNANYQQFSSLNTSVNDAQAIASVLKGRYGFKTVVLADASRSKMLAAFDSLRKKLDSNDNLLIYYAGHGELAGGSGYWLPVDARKDDKSSWISNAQITNFVDAMKAKHVMVIADSCYSGTMSQSSIPRPPRSDSAKSREWYETVAKTKVRVVLSSGGVKPVLDTGGGKHSVFASALLSALQTGSSVVEGARLYNKLKGRVSSAASKAGISQSPQFAPIRFAGHEAGDFVFLKGGQVALGDPLNPDNGPNALHTALLAILSEKWLLGLRVA
ncbi:MAG: caspase family protein, partial [Thiothrix litoralis]